MSQIVLPGIEPRDSETEYGRMVLRLRERLGWADALKVMHWVKYGEELAAERAKVIQQVRDAA